MHLKNKNGGTNFAKDVLKELKRSICGSVTLNLRFKAVSQFYITNICLKNIFVGFTILAK